MPFPYSILPSLKNSISNLKFTKSLYWAEVYLPQFFFVLSSPLLWLQPRSPGRQSWNLTYVHQRWIVPWLTNWPHSIYSAGVTYQWAFHITSAYRKIRSKWIAVMRNTHLQPRKHTGQGENVCISTLKCIPSHPVNNTVYLHIKQNYSALSSTKLAKQRTLLYDW